MRSQIVKSNPGSGLPTLTEWEQKPDESDLEYTAFMAYANDETALSPKDFCLKSGYPEMIPVTLKFGWMQRRNAWIEYRGVVSGLRAKQEVFGLLKQTVTGLSEIQKRVYEVIDREGPLSEEGSGALSVFFRCAELSARLTTAINDKAMRINVVTQVNASLPSLSREWDDPGDMVIDGDG